MINRIGKKKGHKIEIKSGTQKERSGMLQTWHVEDMALEIRNSKDEKITSSKRRQWTRELLTKRQGRKTSTVWQLKSK